MFMNECKHRSVWKGLMGKERKQRKHKLSEHKFYGGVFTIGVQI